MQVFETCKVYYLDYSLIPFNSYVYLCPNWQLIHNHTVKKASCGEIIVIDNCKLILPCVSTCLRELMLKFKNTSCKSAASCKNIVFGEIDSI